MYFETDTNSAGKPIWRLYGDNHRKVAWSGETFASSSNAKRAATSFKSGASTARYDVYEDAGGNYRWRAYRSSDKVAASGESFSSQSAARRAADNVRDNAGGADGP